MENISFFVLDGEVCTEGSFPRSRAGALEASILKWKTVVSEIEKTGKKVNDGGEFTCALCHKYMKGDCVRCPVRKETGQSLCIDTPYHDYHEAKTGKRLLKHATAELQFLQGLRDEAEK
jgi:hypothetical protein